MRLYENEAKKVFSEEGISVPRQLGLICGSDQLEELLAEGDFPVMLKSLVLTGGRGKAGGIKRAETLDEAVKLAGRMLGNEIRGYMVEMLMVEEAVEQVDAAYAGVIMNPATYNNIVMVSPAGGVNIEKVAAEDPAAIMRIELRDNEEKLPEGASMRLTEFLIERMDAEEEHHNSIRDAIENLYGIYQKYDCRVAEINPLILTPAGPVAADAKIVLDDNALFRQRRLFEMLGIDEVRHDVSEPTRNEVRARKAGFPYVDLLDEGHARDPEKLYVGIVPGGAGYGIFSIDEVANIGERFFDGRVVPVNFMDSGGGPSREQVAEMFHLLMDYELVDLIITSRFGGVSSCDTFIRGLVKCLLDRHRGGRRMVPVHGRMVGTDLPSARDFLEKAVRDYPEELAGLDITVGNSRIMAEVIKEGIEKAFEERG